MPSELEIYKFKHKPPEDPPVKVIPRRRPFQFPLPVEMSFINDILPDRTQGKSWMANAIIDAFKILVRIRDTIRDSYL